MDTKVAETPSTFKLLYETEATASGGRTGHVEIADGRLALDLSRPKVLGGDDGPGTNPEQLFALGYAACFHSSVQYALKAKQIEAEGTQITATVGLGRIEKGVLGLTVTMRGVFPGLDRATAHEVMEYAHQVCPYSRATQGNIPVTLEVAGE
jgi:lipoyl-dependent peroxiredoxin